MIAFLMLFHLFAADIIENLPGFEPISIERVETIEDRYLIQPLGREAYIASLDISNKPQRNEPRNFDAGLTQAQKDDVTYIFTTLAKHKSKVMLATHMRTLNKKEKNIVRVHPLRFLGFLYSQEELRESMQKVRSYNDIRWKKFVRRTKGSLTDEALHNNLTDRMIDHFASEVNINSELLRSHVRESDWDKFIILLADSKK